MFNWVPDLFFSCTGKLNISSVEVIEEETHTGYEKGMKDLQPTFQGKLT